MSNIFLIILFIYTNCKTEKYYSECLEGAATYDNKIHYLDECKRYSDIDSYCCLLKFKIEDNEHHLDIDLNFGDFFDKNAYRNISNKNKHHRHLKGKEYTCFGLSNVGYYHIPEVIKEVEKESEIENIEIDCFAKNVNLISPYLLSFLFFFIY